ncbi:hypothetical protein CHCC20441_3942 [Bacillus licheniformis]|nr:hypothetical protein B4092_2094 [Bacillus licheniformis]KYC83625.1 hypothetical protein B4091_2203 [Bacillus licheniformis]KYD01286.1 hypothetical protein B4164_1969 [Bacillus licheniformis]OLF86622.1 hypothetical protein B4089_3980 [Bacillus licheniformis]TWJ40383.1 hypothetical protein CHCC5026_0302 [Bacillus licheniformis]
MINNHGYHYTTKGRISEAEMMNSAKPALKQKINSSFHF